MYLSTASLRTLFKALTGLVMRQSSRKSIAIRTAQMIETSEQFMIEQPLLARHWKAIEADGITAGQFVEFLQTLADLEGLMVSPGTESSFFALK